MQHLNIQINCLCVCVNISVQFSSDKQGQLSVCVNVDEGLRLRFLYSRSLLPPYSKMFPFEAMLLFVF